MGCEVDGRTGESNPITESQYSGISGSRFREKVVLVERIITMLTKDDPPMDVDRLLIVTFTEAAASEMKERIRLAIERN